MSRLSINGDPDSNQFFSSNKILWGTLLLSIIFHAWLTTFEWPRQETIPPIPTLPLKLVLKAPPPPLPVVKEEPPEPVEGLINSSIESPPLEKSPVEPIAQEEHQEEPVVKVEPVVKENLQEEPVIPKEMVQEKVEAKKIPEPPLPPIEKKKVISPPKSIVKSTPKPAPPVQKTIKKIESPPQVIPPPALEKEKEAREPTQEPVQIVELKPPITPKPVEIAEAEVLPEVVPETSEPVDQIEPETAPAVEPEPTIQETVVEESVPAPVVTQTSEASEVDDVETTVAENIVPTLTNSEPASDVSLVPAPKVDHGAWKKQARELLQQYLSQIDLIAYYPRRAIRRNMEGTAEIKLIFSNQGKLENIALSQNSPYALLDKAALRLVNEHREEIEKSLVSLQWEAVDLDYSVITPIVFRLAQ